MKSLSETWFVEGNIDFESKKYTLLAYLQRINHCFEARQLYPPLSDLIFHARNLKTFKDKKAILQKNFPKNLNGIDLERLRLIYEEMVNNSDLMEEIEEIVHFALEKMKGTLSNGAELYDYVENNLNITPVGILPYDNDEGYFFLSQASSKKVRVYSYRLSIFERADDKYKSLRSEYVATWQRNLVTSYESIKSELMRARKPLQLPAVFSIETNLSFPMDETILPVAKRQFVKYIS